MAPYQKESILKSRFAVLQTIWTAMFLSVVIYPVAAYMAVSRTTTGGFEGIMVLYVFLAAASALLLMVQLFVRSLLSDGRMFPRLTTRYAEPGREDGSTQDYPGGLLLQEHQSMGIMVWALGEVPGIFGLMLTFMSGDIRFAAGFAAYSLINLFFFRPRYSVFEDQLKRFRRYLETRGYRI